MTSLTLLGLVLFAQGDGTRCISKETNNESITFNSAGTLVAWLSFSLKDGHSIRFWDVKAGKALPSIKWKFDGALRSVALSPDGKTVAALNGDSQPQFGRKLCSVRLWDISTGKLRKEIPTPELLFGERVRFSQDGNLLIAAGSKAIIPVIDIREEKILKVLTTVGSAEDASFTPDGKFVATIMMGHAAVWSIATGEKVAQFDKPPSPVEPGGVRESAIAFSPTRYLVAASRVELEGGGRGERIIDVWDFEKKDLLYTIRTKRTVKWTWARVMFSPDGSALAATNGDNRVTIWDGGTQKEIQTIAIDNVLDFSYSPDGKALAVATKEGVYICPTKVGDKK